MIPPISFVDRLRPWISKMVAAPVGFGLVSVARHIGLIPVNDIQTEAAVVASTTWFISEVIHVVVSKFTNPANTASAHLAAQGVKEHNLVS